MPALLSHFIFRRLSILTSFSVRGILTEYTGSIIQILLENANHCCHSSDVFKTQISMTEMLVLIMTASLLFLAMREKLRPSGTP